MIKNLSKITLAAALMALAEEERRDEAEHRARFDKMIRWGKSEIDLLSSPEHLCTSAAMTAFNEAVDIARRLLRMSKRDFECGTAELNTSISRVIDTCPSGKDHRDVRERMHMRDAELRMSYSLMSPYHASEFIAERGALVGYVPADVARAKIEYTRLEKARRAKVAEEDRQRAQERSAKIDADRRELYLRRLKWEEEHADEHQAKLASLAAQEAAARPHLIEHPVPVFFE